MVYPCVFELGTVVGGILVQPEHRSHVELVFEEIGLLLGGPQLDTLPVGRDVVLRTHEGQEPVGDDPVHVAVLHLLLLHVEVEVECVLVLPPQPGCLLQPAYAIFQSAVILTLAHVRVTEWGEWRGYFFEFFARFEWFCFFDQYHISTCQKCCICPFILIG